jgi:hypothetical protein
LTPEPGEKFKEMGDFANVADRDMAMSLAVVSSGRGSGVAFGALHLGGIDALEDQLQIGGGHFELSRVSRRAGQSEAANLESFVEKSQAIAIPPKHLDSVAAFVAEDEEVAGERVVVSKEILDDSEQPVEAASHVRWCNGDEHACGGW